MSLILRNEEFLARSLEDPDAFGWKIILTNPDLVENNTQEVYGQVRHINMAIDIDTGAEVQQEQLSATVRLSSVTIGEPKKDWPVKTTDTQGNEYDCYVVSAMPDLTFGMVVLEAMICGLPVVATDIPTLRDITAGTAVLLPWGTWNVWAEKIDHLLKNDDLRKKMALEGIEKAKEHVWGKKAEELEVYLIKAAQFKGKLREFR